MFKFIRPATGLLAVITASLLAIPVASAANCPGPLSAPRHITPHNGAKFNRYPRTTRFRWSALKDAKSYGIEIDCYHCCVKDRWCTDVGGQYIIRDGLTSNKFTHNYVGAQPGRWRIWATDACGNKGAVSGWWTFRYTK